MWLQKPHLGVPLDWKKPINKDLVLHLAMNGGHGDKVYDLSGYGNHGTLKNFAFPPTVASGWNPGQKGVALQFDGTNDVIDCGTNPSLDITDAVTIETRVQFASLPSAQKTNFPVIAGRYSAYQIGAYKTDAKIVFRLDDSGDDHHLCSVAESEISTGVFYDLIGTYNGTTQRLYLNGVLVDDVNWSDTIQSIPTSPFSVGAGMTSSSSFYQFNGTIDEVRIHRRALSAKEIRERYINPYGVYLGEEE